MCELQVKSQKICPSLALLAFGRRSVFTFLSLEYDHFAPWALDCCSIKGCFVRCAVWVTIIVLVSVSSTTIVAAADPDWLAASPESQGMSTAKLDALWRNLISSHTTAFLILRNDRIIYEKYAEGWDAKRLHYTAS